MSQSSTGSEPDLPLPQSVEEAEKASLSQHCFYIKPVEVFTKLP